MASFFKTPPLPRSLPAYFFCSNPQSSFKPSPFPSCILSQPFYFHLIQFIIFHLIVSDGIHLSPFLCLSFCSCSGIVDYYLALSFQHFFISSEICTKKHLFLFQFILLLVGFAEPNTISFRYADKKQSC